jgi:hypothetical protein
VSTNPIPNPSGPKFEVAAELREGRLLVKYSVLNPGPLAIYLLNRVPDVAMLTSPDLVYIQQRRDQKVLFLYKDIPPIPPGVSPTMPVAPYVTAVRSGERFEEVVRIDTPVREFSAYLPAPVGGDAVVYAGLQLELGYYSEVPGMQEREMQIVPGVKALIPSPPPGKSIELRKLTSPLVRLNVPVLESKS